MVNKGPGFRAEHLPFGGVKDSGIGREGVKYAVESMTTLKTIVI
jgi:acyl-CoA reductase-like NAD-dependent aldehyde dehydrogenase